MKKRERRGDFVRAECDGCGMPGFWVKVGNKALDHEAKTGGGLTWLPAFCADCMESGKQDKK